MSNQLRIVHRTGYTYPGGAHMSYNEARMTPQSNQDQVVTHSRLDITPTPWTYNYTDYWGTVVTAFELHERHERLQLTSTSTVEVARLSSGGGGLAWADLGTPEVTGVRGEFLELSDLTDPGMELGDLTAELAAQASVPGDYAREVFALLHEQVSYEPGSTGVHTRAAEAWVERRGICQDIVHLALGALRTVGIPARYVSGYVMPKRNADLGVPVTGESHAWLQWWDGEWVSHDPANDRAPDDFYVDVGRGRDYRDVTPLRGIFTGVRTSSMFAEVEITRLA